MRLLLSLMLLSVPVFAQSDKPFSVSLGAKIGTPLNDSKFSGVTQGRWTGGPSIEVRLPYRFALEFNALYRTGRSEQSFPLQIPNTTSSYFTQAYSHSSIWDFPLLLKYRFQIGPLRPFVSGGYSWSRSSTETTAIYTCLGPRGSCLPADQSIPEPRGGRFVRSAFQAGSPVVGAGLEFKTRYLTIAPEFRYDRPIREYPVSNRFTALVGFTWGKKK